MLELEREEFVFSYRRARGEPHKKSGRSFTEQLPNHNRKHESGLRPAPAKSGLPPATKLSPVIPENIISHARHAKPCTNFWFAFIPMLPIGLTL